jgi:hypothetical protein
LPIFREAHPPPDRDAALALARHQPGEGGHLPRVAVLLRIPLHLHRRVQTMSKHRNPKTLMRYDHRRENLEQSAVNFLVYDEA